MTEFAGRGRHPPIVNASGGRSAPQRRADVVILIGRPIEHRLGADKEATGEFIVDAGLAAAEKRGVDRGRESGSEHVGESAGGEPGAEIAADIEARPGVGGSGRRRWRQISRQSSGPINQAQCNNIQCNDRYYPFHKNVTFYFWRNTAIDTPSRTLIPPQ
jgi:hypothetical protein